MIFIVNILNTYYPIVCSWNISELLEHINKLVGWNPDKIELYDADNGKVIDLQYMFGTRVVCYYINNDFEILHAYPVIDDIIILSANLSSE